MKTPIGSDFHLPLSHLFWMKKRDVSAGFSSGRCALVFIIESLGLGEGDTVLLPDYLCPEIVQPFHARGIRTDFYTIKKNFRIDFHNMREKMKRRPRLLLVIHYFGFPQDMDKITNVCKRNDILLVEDCTHGWLSVFRNRPLGTFGDFSFVSLRKWVAIPDGALFFSAQPVSLKVRHSVRHFIFVLERYVLLLARSLCNLTFHTGLSKLEKLCYPKPAPMSLLSLFIVNRTNIREIKKRRRANFLLLLGHLKNKKITPVFDQLADGVVPIGFPVFSEDRDNLKRYLIKRNIYPPVHWDIGRMGSPRARWMARHIITLPIDQRYSEKEMKKLVEVLNAY